MAHQRSRGGVHQLLDGPIQPLTRFELENEDEVGGVDRRFVFRTFAAAQSAVVGSLRKSIDSVEDRRVKRLKGSSSASRLLPALRALTLTCRARFELEWSLAGLFQPGFENGAQILLYTDNAGRAACTASRKLVFECTVRVFPPCIIAVVTDWIDVSVPIRNGMVHWPGDPPFHIEHASDQAKGDVATVSKMTLGVHTGTHMDAPVHFIRGAEGIDQIPLDATVGPARIIPIRDKKSIKREELMEHSIQSGERILFKTVNSDHAWDSDDFDEDFVYISKEAAAYLVECGVRAVGVDYLSVGGFREDGPETHEALLGGGIWIIEGLDFNGVEPGNYELICLPLRLIGSDGSPARAIVREIE